MVCVSAMKYTDQNRGKIQNRERARQIIDFSGIRYGNITPTDIDGFFEKAGRAFVFYEYKLVGNDMPYGQKIALERIVDAISTANKEAVLFVCRHCNDDPRDDIEASKAVVEKIYWHGDWWDGTGKTVKRQTDDFMDYVSKKENWIDGL